MRRRRESLQTARRQLFHCRDRLVRAATIGRGPHSFVQRPLLEVPTRFSPLVVRASPSSPPAPPPPSPCFVQQEAEMTPNRSRSLAAFPAMLLRTLPPKCPLGFARELSRSIHRRRPALAACALFTPPPHLLAADCAPRRFPLLLRLRRAGPSALPPQLPTRPIGSRRRDASPRRLDDRRLSTLF